MQEKFVFLASFALKIENITRIAYEVRETFYFVARSCNLLLLRLVGWCNLHTASAIKTKPCDRQSSGIASDLRDRRREKGCRYASDANEMAYHLQDRTFQLLRPRRMKNKNLYHWDSHREWNDNKSSADSAVQSRSSPAQSANNTFFLLLLFIRRESFNI